MDIIRKSRLLPFGKEVNDNELFLIYVHKIGENSKGNFEYEFIFSVSPNIAIGEKWEELPNYWDQDGESKKPDKQYIDKIGKLETEIELQTVYEEGSFRVLDAVYKIIALCWEIVDDYSQSDILPEDILVFHFGDSMVKVKEKLHSKDLKLKFDMIN
jgi:hypothetical protein